MTGSLMINKPQIIQITVYESDNFSNDNTNNSNNIKNCGFNLGRSAYYLLKTGKYNNDELENEYSDVDSMTNCIIEKLSSHVTTTLTIDDWIYRLVIDQNNDYSFKNTLDEETYSDHEQCDSNTSDDENLKEDDECGSNVYKITRKLKHTRIYHRRPNKNVIIDEDNHQQQQNSKQKETVEDIDDYDYREKWYDSERDASDTDDDDEIIEEDVYEIDCYKEDENIQENNKFYTVYNKLQKNNVDSEFDVCEEDSE